MQEKETMQEKKQGKAFSVTVTNNLTGEEVKTVSTNNVFVVNDEGATTGVYGNVFEILCFMTKIKNEVEDLKKMVSEEMSISIDDIETLTELKFEKKGGAE